MPRAAWRADLASGFLVFLIALPLCLGISMASGFPPLAGVVTAVVGGVLGVFLGSAPLTIKGPAAGLILVVASAVEELGEGDPLRGFHAALGVVVVSGLLLAALGFAKAGRLGDFFPASAVHGMLAAIGLAIVARQAHVLVGATPTATGALGLLVEIPHSVTHANPGVAVIGLASLAILFAWPLVKQTRLGAVPGPVVALLVSVPLGLVLDLGQEHRVHWGAMLFSVGPKFLVGVPERLRDAIHFPDFAALPTLRFWKHVVVFTLVAGLESMLAARAIDTLDPWQRKTRFDRDLIAQGLSNAVAGLLGGLPMISEIVRSSANVNNGGRTRWANFFHGVFLLGFVGLLPRLVHHIPLAALAAMLIYTGVRLASPMSLAQAWEVGRVQLAVFVTTLVVTLATGVLTGIAAGVALKLACHLARGVGVRRLFHTRCDVGEEGDAVVVTVHGAAVFSNFPGLKKQVDRVAPERTLVLDFSRTRLVDHSVLHHLSHEQRERERAGGRLELRGLEGHRKLSAHPLATRLQTVQRLVAEPG